MDDKEIAKELTIAALQRSYLNGNANNEQYAANQVAIMFKTLYAVVHDVDKDNN